MKHHCRYNIFRCIRVYMYVCTEYIYIYICIYKSIPIYMYICVSYLLFVSWGEGGPHIVFKVPAETSPCISKRVYS